MRTPVRFPSNNMSLAGILYLPDTFDGTPLPAVIVSGPATSIKEQSSGRYAEELSKKGFITLAYDAAYQGESEGEPRLTEDPFQRAEDARAAVSFLTTRAEVVSDRIGALGVCASGAYVPYAAQTDKRMRAVATVSAVDPGAELLANDDTRNALLEQNGMLRTLTARTGSHYASDLIPATLAEAAAQPEGSMYRETYTYYRTADGKQHDRAPGWAVARFDLIAQFDAYRNNAWIAPRPLLMIAGTAADTHVFSKDGVAKAGENAELFDIEGATHVDLYYRDEYVAQAVDKLTEFYTAHLTN